MAEPTEKQDHRHDAIGWFTSAVLMWCTARLVAGPANANWDDDAWWPLFAVIAVLCGLAGVRSLARHVRERRTAADAGEGTTQ